MCAHTMTPVRSANRQRGARAERESRSSTRVHEWHCGCSHSSIDLPGSALVNTHIRTRRLTPAAVLCLAAVTLWPTTASAQHHGGPAHGHSSTVIVGAPPYFGYAYYDPFWWGYPGGHPGWYGPAAPAADGADVGSARREVKPRSAEVSVDGYLAGPVDNFDGFLQRLDVAPGAHDPTIYLEGHRTVPQKVLFRPGPTLKIKYALQ